MFTKSVCALGMAAALVLGLSACAYEETKRTEWETVSRVGPDGQPLVVQSETYSMVSRNGTEPREVTAVGGTR